MTERLSVYAFVCVFVTTQHLTLKHSAVYVLLCLAQGTALDRPGPVSDSHAERVGTLCNDTILQKLLNLSPLLPLPPVSPLTPTSLPPKPPSASH